MDQQQFWKQRFFRYAKGKSQPIEDRLLDEFFEKHQASNSDIWNDLKKSPEQVRQRILLQLQQAIRPTFFERILRYSFGKGIAATLLMVMGLGYFFFTKEEPVTNNDHQSNEVEWQSFQTNAAEQKVVKLPDGSTIHLNYQSSIRFEQSHFGQKERRVYLQGEAFFEVTKDTLRPFVVASGQLTTRVLGTSFNINAHDDVKTVAVASGEVEVSSDFEGHKNQISLKPNQGASLNCLNEQLIFIDQVSQETFLWREGVLSFQNVALKTIVSQLERAYGVKISCAPALLKRTITARYQQRQVKDVLDDLCFLLGATYEINANQHISITLP